MSWAVPHASTCSPSLAPHPSDLIECAWCRVCGVGQRPRELTRHFEHQQRAIEQLVISRQAQEQAELERVRLLEEDLARQVRERVAALETKKKDTEAFRSSKREEARLARLVERSHTPETLIRAVVEVLAEFAVKVTKRIEVSGCSPAADVYGLTDVCG
jgi:hypothetical protein